ncbi:hypothetical protein DEH80_16825 [Abyssibacter profundi]|uniref:Uncharacterized protein n=1 Tax=Abyssibacter profundi TaxID=2182787 RepID=A0A383XPL8_9GAMM|nr:hypothetical protein DEH80_16825 [Abyssibacter profundi]
MQGVDTLSVLFNFVHLMRKFSNDKRLNGFLRRRDAPGRMRTPNLVAINPDIYRAKRMIVRHCTHDCGIQFNPDIAPGTDRILNSFCAFYIHWKQIRGIRILKANPEILPMVPVA